MSHLPRSIYLDVAGIRVRTPPRPPPPPLLRLVAAGPFVAPPPALDPDPVVAPAPSPPVHTAHDDAILATLATTSDVGESAQALYRRKEHLLGALFATLTVSEAMALHQRLSTLDPGDAVCVQFGRLVADRRERLLAFLETARRRAAIEAARRPFSSTTRTTP